MSLSYPSAPHLPDLHAFPTRRSSALRSLQAVADWLPQRLCLTHFGRIDDVASQLERVREGLRANAERSEEHTSELQSPDHLVCRLLLEKKKKHNITYVLLRHI